MLRFKQVEHAMAGYSYKEQDRGFIIAYHCGNEDGHRIAVQTHHRNKFQGRVVLLKHKPDHKWGNCGKPVY